MKRASVELSKYSLDWPLKFEVEKELPLGLIGSWKLGNVEHVGSTSVPGLATKPVINIMFGVESL